MRAAPSGRTRKFVVSRQSISPTQLRTSGDAPEQPSNLHNRNGCFPNHRGRRRVHDRTNAVRGWWRINRQDRFLNEFRCDIENGLQPTTLSRSIRKISREDNASFGASSGSRCPPGSPPPVTWIDRQTGTFSGDSFLRRSARRLLHSGIPGGEATATSAGRMAFPG